MININGLKTHCQQLRSDLSKIKSTLALTAALPRYFREQITVQQAEEEIKRLLDNRVERFFELIRTRIYERPDSPYLKLLKHAGCEFSDLHAQVCRHGLERALVQLAKEGVYLTSDEFKGEKNVVRGAQSFRVSPDDFAPRASSAGFITQSSGTANAPFPTFASLEGQALRAMGVAIGYSANDRFSCANAVYEPLLADSVGHVLNAGKLGMPMDRWFVRKIPAHSWLEDAYHYLATYLVAIAGTWFGPGIAKPDLLDEEDVRPIVEWILAKRREGKKCSISTVASNAVRIARRALEMGVSLEGTTLSAGGEPLTESKRAVIEGAGARTAQSFAYGWNIRAGQACGNPRFTGEVHIEQSLVALVEHPQPLANNGAIYPLLITTLHPMAPRLLLNVENGDYGTMVRRDCECPLEKVGFTQHLHTIRSFEKFTSEGMNYFGTDLFEVLEKIIPSEFGGGPGDYQLVEEEDPSGQTRITLLVHPEVGELDEQRLLTALQDGLAQGSRDNRYMAKVWQAAGTLRVRREVPQASPRGKILPLHIRPVR